MRHGYRPWSRAVGAALILASLIVAAPVARAQLTAPNDPNAKVDEAISVVQGAADTAESLGNMADKIARLADDAKTVSTPAKLARQANSLSEQMDIILGDARFADVNLIEPGAVDYSPSIPGGPYTVKATDLSTGTLNLRDFDFATPAKAEAARKTAVSAVKLINATKRRYRADILALSKRRVAIPRPYADRQPSSGGGAAPGGFDVQGLLDRLRQQEGQ